MTQQSSAAVAKFLLNARNKMEKKQNKTARIVQRARDVNPIDKFPVLKALQDIQTLKNTTGKSRKTIAASLAKTLLSPPKGKSGFKCKKCGAQVASGIIFCGECGTRVK